jgi:ribonuclease-3
VGTDTRLGELEHRLGYRFADRQRLATALTHRSFANEHRGEVGSDNERLEFLGDAVLDLIIGHMLMDLFPDLREGELSVTRAQVVSEAGLVEVARELELGDVLRLGRGEERTGGRTKVSILADAVEAVVAAVYLDGGFDAARDLVTRLFRDRVATLEPRTGYDFKTRLQEAAQARLRATPEYRVVGEHGPDHDKTFDVCVRIQGVEWARGRGKSKKAAEQRAAAAAVTRLEAGDAPPSADDGA